MISSVFVQRIDWRGITVEISYEPNWLGGLSEAFGEPLAHLQIRSASPERAALPVTKTGYRSAFLAGSVVRAEGGPVTFVREWLDEAAQDESWRQLQESARQLSFLLRGYPRGFRGGISGPDREAVTLMISVHRTTSSNGNFFPRRHSGADQGARGATRAAEGHGSEAARG